MQKQTKAIKRIIPSILKYLPPVFPKKYTTQKRTDVLQKAAIESKIKNLIKQKFTNPDVIDMTFLTPKGIKRTIKYVNIPYLFNARENLTVFSSLTMLVNNLIEIKPRPKSHPQKYTRQSLITAPKKIAR